MMTIAAESSKNPPELVLVFLHGFCMSVDDMAKDFVELFKRFPTVRFVFPEAPRLKITAYKGEENNAWFNYITDHDGNQEDVIELASLTIQRANLMTLLAQERRKNPRAKFLIGGLSQGGCMALDLATKVDWLDGVVTCVAHRLYTSLSRPLLCPWYALTAENDECFPSSWANPGENEALIHKVAPGASHYLTGGEGPTFVGSVIEQFLTK